jgi:transcriptional regulator with XRE-family HTH domain
MKLKRPLNLIGPQVRKLRDAKGWTQEQLAQRLQRIGWDVSRISVSKLEAQIRRVPDGEVLFVARVLKTRTDELFPKQLDLAAVGQTFRRTLGKDDREPPSPRALS